MAMAALVAAPALGAQMTPGAPKPASAYVIRNATVVPVTGPRINNGTLVIQNGKITAVGPSVATPAGATVIDGTGLFVYPGLINAGTYIGVSLITVQSFAEQIQANLFVDAQRESTLRRPDSLRGDASVNELITLVGRFLGQRRAQDAFAAYARQHPVQRARHHQ